MSNHDYVWARFKPYVDLQFGERWRAFAHLIFAHELGDEAGLAPVDENRADILQGFVDVRDAWGRGETTLRVGRQMLEYGTGRLISTRYGPNVPLSFDAALVMHRGDGWTLDLLYAQPVANEPGAFDDESSESRSLWSAYFSRELDRELRQGFDLYYIGYGNESARFNAGTGDEERHTLAARLFGTSRGGWDWNAELFGQFGQFRGGDIWAWSLGTDTGFTWRDEPWSPRLGVRANIISGDDDPNDGKLGTFNALFPKGNYFGDLGTIGPYNLINVHPLIQVSPSKDLTLTVGADFYWRESTGDGVYSIGGFLLRSDGGSDERYIGTQVDVSAIYQINRELSSRVTYSALDAGAFIEDTGPSEGVSFLTLELNFRF